MEFSKALPPQRMELAQSTRRVRPMYFIGDSNVMIFSYLGVAAPRFFPLSFVTRALYCPKLSLAELIDAAGAFDERFERSLLAERLLNRTGPGRYEAPHRERYTREHALAVGEFFGSATGDLDYLVSPPLVFMLGALDLGWILTELGPNADFIFDDPRCVEDDFPDRARAATVPMALVRELVDARLTALGTTLDRLRNLGFDRIFVHSVTPPTPSDARYYRWRGVSSQLFLRSKTALMLNDGMRAVATARGATFLDMWDEVADRGVLADRYYLDGDHFNKAAAELTLERLLGELAHRAPDPVALSEHPILSNYVPRAT